MLKATMRRTPYPSTARPVFLKALSRCECVTAAVLAANVSRATVYEWRAKDPDFAAAWEDALSLGLCGLEDKAIELAMSGSEKLIIFLLSSKRPEVYGLRSTLELNGQLSVGLNRVPLDQLRAELATILQSRQPLTIEAPAANVVPLHPVDEDG